MSRYWCSNCHQFYSEAGYCPFDGARLSISPEAVSAHSARAISAHDGEEAVKALLQANSGEQYEKLVGQTLDGRYLIERKIGEGGMGVVYAARHLVIERPLAIKVLKREVARDQSTIKRFVQEAKAASRIGHPHIVDVTDFGTTPDGLTYSVMEYVDGSTLSSAIKLSAPLPLERILPVAAQIAQALDAAHGKGIVHRDLKPENIFLMNRDGRRDFVKIVDFGIAKVTPIDNAPVEGPRLTRAGAVFGTPEYMAPEQAAGRSDTDGRVDIYALGTIMYEMLTGRVPHKSESMVRTLAMQMLDPIEPPSKIRPDLPIAPEVEAVVMRALAKKREQRYQKMSELYDAIKSVSGNIELSQPVSSSVTAQKQALQLQPLPPGASSGPSAETVRPPRATLDSAPPPPLAPVTASDTDLTAGRGRARHEPAFVTKQPRAETFQIVDDEPPPQVSSRWPVAVGAILLFGAAGVAAALLLGGKDQDQTQAPGDRDAGVVAELTVDAGNRVIEVPVDAAVVVEIPTDAGHEDAGRVVVRNPRDAGPGPGPNTKRDGGIGRTPGERGNVSIEVITRPDGGILYIDQSYRGPGGTHLEEPRGSRVKVKCTLPGYDPGYLDLVFDGKTEAAICSMTRTVKCIPGIKNPFDDCPD
ncbi:MAG TPA: protein kinase [Kofleriaceae bacterium]|nr:protein kinase [Kofleriaceae bacterium]